MPPTLITIPADPSRIGVALLLEWPGIGWWDWTTFVWDATFEPTCLLPLTPIPGDVPADTLGTWVEFPPAAAETLMKIVALDPSGTPVRTISEGTLGAMDPPGAGPAPVMPTPTPTPTPVPTPTPTPTPIVPTPSP